MAPIVDLHFHRKRQEGKTADVYFYDSLPETLRYQASVILGEAIGVYGTDRHPQARGAWIALRNQLRREFGRPHLGAYDDHEDAEETVLGFVRSSTGADEVLSVIELCIRFISNTAERYKSQDARQQLGIKLTADSAIAELNARFLRAGVGYQFDGQTVIQVDNTMMHKEVILPALTFLADGRFSGANDELRSAFDHFRAGENKDAAVDAHNALESTMKAICDAMGLSYYKGARATELAKILKQSDLFPDYLDKSFEQLVATLSSGLPAVRNQSGAHGQGSTVQDVPAYVAAYAIHLAGTQILFLAEAFQSYENRTKAP